jgi:hypothetical protein
VSTTLLTRQELCNILCSVYQANESAARTLAGLLPEDQPDRLIYYRKGVWDVFCALSVACGLGEPGPEPRVEDGRALSEWFSPIQLIEGEQVDADAW